MMLEYELPRRYPIIDLCAICGVEFEKTKYAKRCKCDDCLDLDLCMTCEAVKPTISMVETEAGDLICEDCACPKCKFCKAPLPSDSLEFCSKHCIDGYNRNIK